MSVLLISCSSCSLSPFLPIFLKHIHWHKGQTHFTWLLSPFLVNSHVLPLRLRPQSSSPQKDYKKQTSQALRKVRSLVCSSGSTASKHVCLASHILSSHMRKVSWYWLTSLAPLLFLGYYKQPQSFLPKQELCIHCPRDVSQMASDFENMIIGSMWGEEREQWLDAQAVIQLNQLCIQWTSICCYLYSHYNKMLFRDLQSALYASLHSWMVNVKHN